jgi:transcription initiation factor TFIIE subunit alpha
VPKNLKITSDIVDEIVSEVAGEDVLPLVKALRNKANVSEFKLADSIKREINLTRNMLYRLYDNNLVSFIRKKDKKKGWYIYYWTFNQKRVKDLVGEIKKRKLERLQERLHREKNTQFYICTNKCVRLDFEQSHDFSFKCPECGQLLDLEDNSRKIMELEAELAKMGKELVARAPRVVAKPVKAAKPKKKAKKKR